MEIVSHLTLAQLFCVADASYSAAGNETGEHTQLEMSRESHRDIPQLSEEEEDYEGDYDYEEDEPEISEDFSEEDNENGPKYEEIACEPAKAINIKEEKKTAAKRRYEGKITFYFQKII